MWQQDWLEQTAKVLQRRAPLFTEQDALHFAGELFVAWGNLKPEKAVANFFRPVDEEDAAASRGYQVT